MQHLKLARLIVSLGTTWGLNMSLMKAATLSGIPYTLLAVLTIFGNCDFTGPNDDALIATATGTERLTLRRLAGIALGFVSVRLIAMQDLSLLKCAFGIELLAAVFVPFIYGSYHVLIARFWPGRL